MIAQLRGTIMLIDDAGIVIDVAGVGYAAVSYTHLTLPTIITV